MAIAEEFIFRVVVLIGLIRAGARVSLALVLQALLFTVFHQGGGIYAQVVIFTIAMALGFFVMHTKSVIPAMIAHATWNLTELTRSVLVGGDFLGVSAAPPTEFMDVIIPATVSLSMLTAAIVGYALNRSTAPRLSEAPVQQCEQLSNPNPANAAWRAW
ncbi:MAG: CPBP family intramembrane metalloprotease [Burkholderiales bacterium]|nr:CPBP family intramembrane metalloprotease [Burkholderiales bacterium]